MTRTRRPEKGLFFCWNDPCANQRRIAESKKKNCRGCCKRWETNEGRTDRAKRCSFFFPPFKSIGRLSCFHSPTLSARGMLLCTRQEQDTEEGRLIDPVMACGCVVLERGLRIARCMACGDHCGSSVLQVSRTTFSRCVCVAKRTLTRV
jgi:hypothetical protein